MRANIIRIATAMVLVGGAFAAGFQLPEQAPPGTRSTPATVHTTFVSLQTNIVSIPVARAGQGGGLTSVSNELLLLTYSGETFAVSNTAKKLSIAVPDNGSESYESAASSAKYKHLQHEPGWLRYNDVIYSRPTPRATSPSRIRTGEIKMSVTTPR